MKLIKTLNTLRIRFLTKLPNSDTYSRLFVSLSCLSVIAIAIWFAGPAITWHGQTPFAQTDKRMCIIAILFLIWLLKYLIIDLDSPNPFQYKDPHIRQALQSMQTRFYGALQFLKKTTITRYHKLIHLNQLPWFLFIGPMHAGKTALLAKSNVKFILQRQFNHTQFETSENCDWWVTRDACIIDVPGKYLQSYKLPARRTKSLRLPILWRFFLSLVKYLRGENAISGIILALPLPELMKEEDAKKYQLMLHELMQSIQEFKTFFDKPLPCYILITKSDLLPGFKEFFSECGNEEATQVWGITHHQTTDDENIHDLFSARFDALIKKLNQQLLWRLHHERDPFARPHIKDFPLQVERLKNFILDVVKKFSSEQFGMQVRGIYLTSALQPEPAPTTSIIDEGHTSQRTVQVFQNPTPISRPYFIKQFLLHGLTTTYLEYLPTRKLYTWQWRTAIVLAIAMIGGTAFMLGRDFEQGVNKAYSVQNYISEYQLAIGNNQDPDDHLIKTTALLDTLQGIANEESFKLDSKSFLSFYSHKSHQKANDVYQQALKTILLPEMKSYIEEYLKNPVNKNTDNVYAVLRAYLMLGDTQYFQADSILNTIHFVLPKSLNENKLTHLMNHFTLALNTVWAPFNLNTDTVQDTRKYLQAIPSLQLSYVILKNIKDNNVRDEMNLGTANNSDAVLITRQISTHIPKMFTATAFPHILTEETPIAAKEAAIGNWILGTNPETTAQDISALQEQLRLAYVNNYIAVWETLMANIQLAQAKNLAQLDTMIISLTGNHSPLLQFLQTMHDNTYFEPVVTASEKLKNLGMLVDKSNSAVNLLYQIFAGLHSLHQTIQTVMTSDNEKKAAFEFVVSHRLETPDKPDAISQLRLIAAKSPEPVKTWLNKIANDTWHFFMQDSARYIDTSWQDKVARDYQSKIANRYPFNPDAKKDVDLQQFTQFFGNPGTLTDFYNHYLQAFIDTSNSDWHWKTLDNVKLPFSDQTLHQIQEAMHIHQLFFPNDDNKLSIEFALQPYQFGKKLKQVKLNINDKEIVDAKNTKDAHVIAWPNNTLGKKTSIQLTMDNKKILKRDVAGEWALFKLVNQTFETALTKEQMLINFSMNDQPVKYMLSTDGRPNPLISHKWHQLYLPQKLVVATK